MNFTVMNIIMGLPVYGLIIPLYFFFANYRLPKKNIILGVTVPYAEQEDPAVLEIGARYVRRLRMVTILAVLFGLPLFFLSYMSILILIMLTMILLFLLATGLVFVQGNRALAALKHQSGWGSAIPTVPAVADLRAMDERSRPIPRLLFILPCLVGAIPLVPLVLDLLGGADVWGQALAYGLTVIWLPLLVVLAENIRRQNAEIVGTVSDLNVALTRIRRREYLRCMALAAWLLALTAVALWFQTAVSDLIFLGLITVLSVVVVVYAFRAEFAVRRAQEKFTQLAGATLAVDDDAFWFWGMFYHNRDDNRLLIKDRIGMNMSINLGKPIGLFLGFLGALLLLAMPLFGVWAVAEEFSPIRYSIVGTTVTVTHVRARQFELGEDFEAEVLNSLPQSTRTAGTSLGTLRKGNFNFQGIGSAWVLYHTDQGPFIVLTAENGRVLVFNFDPVFEVLLR
ncbi:MAG: hypothetical protein FWC72_04610 [Oscillospiraceae bacterium]|nr:hypothetical protein [Oscillospiraceae bacterium]